MDTIKIVKGNIELDVPADQKDRYLKLGYSVIDNNGKIVEEAPIADVGALQSKVSVLLEENTKLKSENAKLKDEVSKLKKPVKKEVSKTEA